MTPLDLSVERRRDDIAQYLNGLFARHLGRPAFCNGTCHKDIYSAVFSNEDAARVAMTWAEDDLSDMRLTPRTSSVTLTGVIGGGL